MSDILCARSVYVLDSVNRETKIFKKLTLIVIQANVRLER